MAAGMVKTHATTIFEATPQRTADERLDIPTPIIEPVTVWVVLTGIPKIDDPITVIAPPVSAQKPPTGFKSVSPTPNVFITFHPPAKVPNEIAE